MQQKFSYLLYPWNCDWENVSWIGKFFLSVSVLTHPRDAEIFLEKTECDTFSSKFILESNEGISKRGDYEASLWKKNEVTSHVWRFEGYLRAALCWLLNERKKLRNIHENILHFIIPSFTINPHFQLLNRAQQYLEPRTHMHYICICYYF